MDQDTAEVKSGVGQSKPKFVAWLNGMLVEVSVIDVQALGEILLRNDCIGVIQDFAGWAVVVFVFGDCVG
ncbi:hypothetical protein KCU62_g3, partial [Aureobasidium sp. EXF-3399]